MNFRKLSSNVTFGTHFININQIRTMTKKNFLPTNPLRKKSIYLTATFFLTPILTHFVMSGGTVKNALVFAVITSVFAAALVILCINDKKNIRGAVTVATILIAAFISSLSVYTLGYRNAFRLAGYAGDESHSFCGYITGEDADTSSSMFVEIISVNGKSLYPSVVAQGYNHSGHYMPCGTYIEFEAKLELAENRNSEFNEWLKSKNVHTVLSGINGLSLDSSKDKLSIASVVKDFFSDRMVYVFKTVPDRKSFENVHSVADAMMFGDKSKLDGDLKTHFSKSGIIHILCVSGLHFSVMLGGLSLVLKYTVKKRKARCFIIVAAGLFYLFVCGFTRSAVRAAVMALIGAISVSGAKRSYCTYALLFSVCVICIADPSAVFDSGFRMSCVCCTGILCAAHFSEMLAKRLAYRPVLSYVISSFLVSLSASAFLFPYSLCAFGGASSVSVIASSIAVLPAQIFLVLCWIAAIASFAGVGFLNFVSAEILSNICNLICNIAKFFSELEFSYIEYEMPDISFLVFIIILGGATIASFSKHRAVSVYIYTVSASVLATAVLLVTSIG